LNLHSTQIYPLLFPHYHFHHPQVAPPQLHDHEIFELKHFLKERKTAAEESAKNDEEADEKSGEHVSSNRPEPFTWEDVELWYQRLLENFDSKYGEAWVFQNL
jgi:G3E family GTPase